MENISVVTPNVCQTSNLGFTALPTVQPIITPAEFVYVTPPSSPGARTRLIIARGPPPVNRQKK